MKKLSLLMALMLLMTVSGVYAVWTYSSSSDIADAYDETQITINDYQLAGANGIYTVESNLAISVDQKATDDHTAVLVFSSVDGDPIHLTVTFKPADHAEVDIKAGAIDTELYFTTTTNMQFQVDGRGHYDPTNGTAKDILKFKNKGDGNFSANIVGVDSGLGSWTKGTDQEDQKTIFTYTLDENALKDWIQLANTFVLDNVAAHDAFRAALNGAITARVTDGQNIGATAGN